MSGLSIGAGRPRRAAAANVVYTQRRDEEASDEEASDEEARDEEASDADEEEEDDDESLGDAEEEEHEVEAAEESDDEPVVGGDDEEAEEEEDDDEGAEDAIQLLKYQQGQDRELATMELFDVTLHGAVFASQTALRRAARDFWLAHRALEVGSGADLFAGAPRETALAARIEAELVTDGTLDALQRAVYAAHELYVEKFGTARMRAVHQYPAASARALAWYLCGAVQPPAMAGNTPEWQAMHVRGLQEGLEAEEVLRIDHTKVRRAKSPDPPPQR